MCRQCCGYGVHDALSDVGGLSYMGGGELARCEVTIFSQDPVPADVVCGRQVLSCDAVAQPLAGVLEDDAVRTLAAARPESGYSHVAGDRLADRVMT